MLKTLGANKALIIGRCGAPERKRKCRFKHHVTVHENPSARRVNREGHVRGRPAICPKLDVGDILWTIEDAIGSAASAVEVATGVDDPHSIESLNSDAHGFNRLLKRGAKKR
jgi:hypothetical protein